MDCCLWPLRPPDGAALFRAARQLSRLCLSGRSASTRRGTLPGGARLGCRCRNRRLLLEALTPDRLALAIAALGELENEARALEHVWALKRERARYEAERARRQYDAVEPENRLVARSLERVWEDKLRQAEQIDIEYESWRRQQPISLAAADRAQIISVGEDLPKLWDAASGVERKQKIGRAHV